MIHEEKLQVITNVAFRNKVAEAALLYAKGLLIGTIPDPTTAKSIKKFGQIVLKEIATPNPSWLDGLCYFTLTNTASLTAQQALDATQAVVTTEVNIVFPFFAKAHYGDIS